MNKYIPKLREKTVHSSLVPFDNYDSDFVFEQPKLGVLVRTGYHRGLERQVADVYWETPSLTAPGQGEIVEIDKLDGFVRAKLIEIADYCRSVGEELLANAARLEEEACKEGELFDNLPKVDDKDIDNENELDNYYDEAKERSQDEEVEILRTKKNRPTRDYTPNPIPRKESTSSGKRGRQAIDYTALNEEDDD